MPRRIEEDHKDFRDVYGGRIRKELKRFISNGDIFRTRGDGSRVRITIPRIDIPHIVHGDNDEGIGRGGGKKGDVIGKKPMPGDGKGNKAGKDPADGIQISIDMEEVFKFLQDELKLPDLKPKPNQTYEDVKIKYNDIAKQGPESLRHNKRTMLQALKRMAASGEIEKLHHIPGQAQAIKLITPINSDRRYRQYKEIRIPSSNAVIFFGRDGSGSMDQYKCDIVSDMAWWMDLWIRRYYKRTETVYFWHDTQAKEVDQNKFYKYRYGGGTICSSILKEILKTFDNRFPPEKWNIYFFYFTDGENYGSDNDLFNKILQEQFNPEVVNMVGVTQVLSWSYPHSLKEAVDKFKHHSNVRTTSIGPDQTPDLSAGAAAGFYGMSPNLTDEDRNKQILRAIKDLLGAEKEKEGSKAVKTFPAVA
jgi:uncharacterized sporulation protein YeaH/YhbH (DUF444 family)